MRITSITSKILSVIIASFLLMAISVVTVSDRQLKKIIDSSQTEVYTEKIHHIYEMLHRRDQRLQDTLRVDAYIKDFQESFLVAFSNEFYQQDENIFPFIIDNTGHCIAHSHLKRCNAPLSQQAQIQKIINADQGSFDYEFEDEKHWLIYQHFTPWDWIICYSVPLELKYADATVFKRTLIIIISLISAAILFVLLLFIFRLTGTISRLTRATSEIATGNLEHTIEIDRSDELGVLAKSFISMRDSIKEKIDMLKDKNENLRLEISERMLVEKALAAEKEQLAVTLRSIGDGVITTDINGNVALINNVAEDLTGWSQKDAFGEALCSVFNIVNEKTRKPCNNPAEKVLKTGSIIGLENHTVLIAKDGTERSIADSGAPIRDKNSKIIGVVLVFRDVTEQLKMEEELIKIKKLESVGVLAGGIAHDFNNILVAILGNLNLAALLVDPEEKIASLLSEAEKATLRARDLTQQLLTFSKGGEPVKETASIPEVIKDSAEFILRGGTIVCQYDIADDLWQVEVDKGQISQVIQNLIMNADQAMPDGGVINIQCSNVDVLKKQGLFLPKGKNYVKITITDSGSGIEKNVIGRIFDPYFSTKKEGNGLGLTITHSIISKHDGHISAQSFPGVGTTFTIYLPATLTKEPQQQEKEEEKVPHPAGGKLTVMVMDDEESVREVAHGMLTYLGYEVVPVNDGEQAIAEYQRLQDTEHPVDVVIMDLTIPAGMGGKEAVTQLLDLNPQAKVIVSSGYSNDPIMADCNEYGFCAAVTKPYQIDDLARAINKVIS